MTGKKQRMSFTEIAKRITGISTPIGGVSWKPPEDKRQIVRGLVTFLEDRRALYADYGSEYGPWVEKSILEIRGELTSILQACPDDENLSGPIRAMRAACRKFLDTAHSPAKLWYPREAVSWIALGELRAATGIQLARLCAAYQVDVEPELASTFPVADGDAV